MDASRQGGRAVVAGGGVAGWWHRTAGFLAAVRTETEKVSWPSRDELTKATRMILIMAVALGVLIGWMDLLLQWILVDGVARLGQ
ncbi:MAG TPA: preprotein translocase subunit SecE [Gemmatimonadales bacterium]|nr:preprotein translocase subunit SecE [Gemmatimonadales bacterium]